MRLAGVFLALTFGVATAVATDQPLTSDKVEKESVRLVLVDVIVVDGAGRTVPGLAAEDFAIHVRGNPVEVDTLDVDCPERPIEDPVGVQRASKRERPRTTADGRRLVLAFDYLHLQGTHRGRAIDQAIEAVSHGAGAGDQIMVAALNGGLRIEQPFTDDHAAVLSSLDRMYYDITLWQPDFHHLTERGFVDGMTGLFDVLGKYPGNKAVVLYSTMGDVPLDLEFAHMATVAAASRCSVYPVDARGLTVPGSGSGTPG